MFSSIKDRGETWSSRRGADATAASSLLNVSASRPPEKRLSCCASSDWSVKSEAAARHAFIFNRHARLLISFLVRLLILRIQTCVSLQFVPPWLQFPACLSASDTLVHLSSFVTSGLSWFLRTEADRCSWLLLLSRALSGKATPSTPFIRQLRDRNVATVRCICVWVCVVLGFGAAG